MAVVVAVVAVGWLTFGNGDDKPCRPTSGQVLDANPRPPGRGDEAPVDVSAATYSIDTTTEVTANLALSFAGDLPRGYRAELFRRQVPTTENSNSLGRSSEGDNLRGGDAVYRPTIAISSPRGCWRQTVTLGTLAAEGVVFSLFVVLLDDEAYNTFVRDLPTAKRIFTIDEVRDGPGEALWISQMFLRTGANLGATTAPVSPSP